MYVSPYQNIEKADLFYVSAGKNILCAPEILTFSLTNPVACASELSTHLTQIDRPCVRR